MFSSSTHHRDHQMAPAYFVLFYSFFATSILNLLNNCCYIRYMIQFQWRSTDSQYAELVLIYNKLVTLPCSSLAERGYQENFKRIWFLRAHDLE